MINRKNLLISYKLFFAALGFSAVVTEIVVLIQRNQFAPGNFFSFFTIEANLFAAGMLLISALSLMGKIKVPSLDLYRGANVLYMLTTIIVFSVLLSGYDPRLLTAVPWDNTVLHYIIPIAVLLDWLVDKPNEQIRFKQAFAWLAFPLLYVVYSLVRGSIVGWYPYPFLNATENGYVSVAIVTVCIAVVVLGLSWIVTRLPYIHSSDK